MDSGFSISLVTQMLGREMEDSLGEMLSLLKSSLLYGDDVTVVSTAVLTAELYAKAPEWDRDQILDLAAASFIERAFREVEPWHERTSIPGLESLIAFLRVVPGTDDVELAEVEWAVRRAQTTPLATDVAIEASILKNFRNGGAAQRYAEKAAPFVRQIRIAEDSGLVVVRRPDMPLLPRGEALQPVRQAMEVELAKDNFLGMDGYMADLVGLREGPSKMYKPVRFGAVLLARLPGFPEADIDDVLKLRSGISDSLGGLRSRIVELSGLMPSGLSDSAHRAEVKLLYARTVAPAIDDLRSEIADNKFARKLRERALAGGTLSRIATEAAAALGIGVVQEALAAGAAVAATVVAALEGSALLLGAASDAKDARTSSRRNPFYVFVAAEEQHKKAARKSRRPRRHRGRK